ncbi:hypothetical protein [Tropicibacter sp. S64]|uniref:hypothetical protein n=1 Tax=Tropicibacter sp. S64 TaxID=3415122 RepID=UPI003C7D07F8
MEKPEGIAPERSAVQTVHWGICLSGCNLRLVALDVWLAADAMALQASVQRQPCQTPVRWRQSAEVDRFVVRGTPERFMTMKEIVFASGNQPVPGGRRDLGRSTTMTRRT